MKVKVEEQPPWGKGGNYIMEYKGIRFGSESIPLSPADRLNGLEWQGWVPITAEAERLLGTNNTWQTWQTRTDPVFLIDCIKTNGQWIISAKEFVGGFPGAKLEGCSAPSREELSRLPR